MAKTILIADLFCGAGGFTTGAQRAASNLDLRVQGVAVNHWPVAVDTHALNHPSTRHLCQDISTVRPIEAVPEGKLDLLLASPTCTFFSRARGGKTTSDQQRADAWHIITWLTELRVKRLLVENVPEFENWGPIHAQTGKPVASRKGEYFRAWIATLRALGFSQVEWRVVNAADHGAYTSRERLFIMARSDGKPIEWPLRTHSKKGVADSSGQGAKRWEGARNVIDWSLEGKSIFNRRKPLSMKTLKRIYAGAVKYGWSEPYLVLLRNHMDAVLIDPPVPTLTAGGKHVALVQARAAADERDSSDADASEQTTLRLDRYMSQMGASTTHEPFIANVAHGDDGSTLPMARSRTLDEPIGTMHAGGGSFALVSPERNQGAFVLSQASGGVARSVGEPIPSLCTGGAHALLDPVGRHGTAPFIANVAHGDEGSASASARTRSVDNPLGTLHAGGVSFALLSPTTTDDGKSFIAPYYGTAVGGSCKELDEPLDTVTTKGRFGFVMPVTHHGDGDRTRDLAQPLPTVTGANRGELAFITPSFGERQGQAPRTHSLEQPMPTLCAQGTINLVEAVDLTADGPSEATIVNLKGRSTATRLADPTPTQTAHAGHLYLAEPIVLNLKKGSAPQSGSSPLPTQTASADHVALATATPNGLDVRFRMLQPEELSKAMGLSSEDAKYMFSGTKTQRIKQIGNAVEAKIAQALCESMLRI